MAKEVRLTRSAHKELVAAGATGLLSAGLISFRNSRPKNTKILSKGDKKPMIKTKKAALPASASMLQGQDQKDGHSSTNEVEEVEPLFQLSPVLTNDSDHLFISNMMASTIVDHCGIKFKDYDIIEIQRVSNRELRKKFNDRKKELEMLGAAVEELTLFHGTPRAREIAEHGFNVALANPTGMFGTAIYFADLSSKCNQYVFGTKSKGCLPHGNKFCEKCTRSMVICQVVLGNTFRTQVAMNGITGPPTGYHSVVGDPGNNLRYREYAVYHNHQAFPTHLVSYRIKMDLIK